MAFWDRLLGKPPSDRIDGYEPTIPTYKDPWSDPGIVRQLARHVEISRVDSEAFNLDSFKNELTGIGDWSQDKTFGGKRGGPDFEVAFLPGIACENRWRGSDLGGRIVETIPDEMTREGWDLTIQPSEGDGEPDDKEDDFPPEGGDPMAAGLAPPAPKNPKPIPEADEESTEQIEELDGLLEKLGAADAFWQALCYERAYGGGAILIGADDGMDDLSTPLNEDAVKSVRFLNPVSGGWDGELVAWSYYRDLNSPNYGMPEIYMLRNLGVPIASMPAPGSSYTPVSPDASILGSTKNLGYGPLVQWVHESRLLVFPGISVSHRARVQMRGWGDSVFMRVDRVLSQYDQTWGGVANLLTDFSQGVLKVDQLSQMLGANNKSGSKNLLTRARMLQMTRSISRILLIDKLEDFSRDTASLAGIAETMQQFALRLAAAADMPVALLMGQAPAGLNATGASDIRFFYDRVAARQKKRLLPQLRRLIKLLMLSKEGPTGGVEPEKWTVEHNSLYQMTDLEKAQLRNTTAQTDQIYISQGVLSAEEVAASAFGGTEWSMERTIDFEGRQEMADLDAADKEARAKAMLEGAKKPPGGDPGGGTPPTPGGDKPPSAPGHTVKVEITPSGKSDAGTEPISKPFGEKVFNGIILD
jgi:phage-related protein (TIGR01555 family)